MTTKLLKICLINPGTDRTMCTAMRKNRNHTDTFSTVSCTKCLSILELNRKWWIRKFRKLGWAETGAEEAWR